MIVLALRNLLQQKGKLCISVSGVAFSVVLVVVLLGLYQGFNTKLGEYVRSIPADIWVAQQGSKNLLDGTSILPGSSQEQITAIPGVSSVKRFNGRQIAIETGGQEKNVFLVGLGRDSGSVAPALIKGSSELQEGEIILDNSIDGLEVGQSVQVGGKTFKLAGIATGSNVLVASFAFVSERDASELFRLDDAANYFVVNIEPGTDAVAVAENIQHALPGTNAMTKQHFIDNTTATVREVFQPIIAVLVLIGMLVGVMVIGLTIVTSTIEKSKEYGVLKAIGLSNSQLYRVVLAQALITSILGFVFGILAGYGISALAAHLVPEFVTDIQNSAIAYVFLGTLCMGAVAAFLPSRRLTKIDPAEVFKA